MKKVFFISFLLSISTLSIAQEESGYGLQLGGAASSFTFEHEDFSKSGDYIFSPKAGVIGYALISERFRLVTEFLFYSGYGTDYTDTVTVQPDTFWDDPETVEATDELRTWAMSWSVLPEFRITDNFFVMGGLVVDYILRRNAKNSEYGAETDAGELWVQSEPERALNAGVTVGAGFSVRNFRVDLRYVKGLTNMLDSYYIDSMGNSQGIEKATLSSFQLSLSYLLPGIDM